MNDAFKNAKLYVMNDREPGPPCHVNPSVAAFFNTGVHGVFHVVNEFHPNQRILSNLTRIRFWFCEMDGSDKATQLTALAKAPLMPTIVVESKNGYHAYWEVEGYSATLENWKRVVRWGLVPFFNGDPKATDPLRLLRAPDFFHNKTDDPFYVRVVWDLDVKYTEAQMLRAFPSQEPLRGPQSNTVVDLDPTKFWHRVAMLDCRDAILRVSGTRLVNHERFLLREMSNGNANILRLPPASQLRGAEDTGCFVDSDGRLGNVKGGSSIAAWCRWYGHSWGDIRNGLTEIYPELEDKQ